MIQTLSATPLVTAVQLGQWLKAARQECKLTQAQVGERLGLSQNRISHLEQHPQDISFKQRLTWCAAVGLDLCLGERLSPSSPKAQW